ncbi:Coenzyme F420 hydrogenase/dehydrogenase, beta subunit C-terminal domain [Leisingera sp. McT4-56]|uniref:Coenzyme F420 hydrogenase/dehydrogenase, beta subunit C-terminal domain n=1 Tax=Leisingera sp. McT4-56 TaxID=2881255 RepID=UPI001CF8BB02|nr:Coenzyme F420 hydrogenase/dehydrogenase, beta subunit C-terminal domain [Leisingera sp. McT4-56]MCB4455638.1 Coenzyme F420 hydrogenase/dehydrogenase, beta subunit C-terminal domain [Leisingera sp. McT4-56]
MQQPGSVKEVVKTGLCIGCGLCEALAPERWKMAYTPQGRLRPSRIGAGSDAEILQACPGVIARPNSKAAPRTDTVWGGYHRMQEAWAVDPDTRFRAASGGVLTALAAHLLRTGEVEFILHCEADPQAPMRSKWCLSDTPGQVLDRAGSRYGPSDTLAGLAAALDWDAPFAVVAKPCDAGALRELAKTDQRLTRNLVAVLVMVCGGASDLGKSQAVLDEYDLSEDDVALFRYRGYGNPGLTRIETSDGRTFQKTYGEMWADESGWRIQTRCKICPDALGEAADVAAADIWPDASPDGDDEGFNGVITRTAAGEQLFRAASEAGSLTVGADITPRQFDAFQPHQVRKKHALAARLRGMAAAGSPVYEHEGLRLETLDTHDAQEEMGTLQRVRGGKFHEELP